MLTRLRPLNQIYRKRSNSNMLTWQVIKWLFIGCGLKGDAGDDGGGGGGKGTSI